MIAAICCPGPSLAKANPVADYFIGVNRAPFIRKDVRFDEWCFGNGNVFFKVQDDGGLGYFPKILLKWDALFEIGNYHRIDELKRYPYQQWEQVFHRWSPMWGWTEFSACAALVGAAHAGATEIRVYGSDRTTAPDADGVYLGGDRSEQRWKVEGEIWDATVKLIDIPVERAK